MKVSLLILTLNEIDGMKAVMPRIDPRWVDQILIVDGGSTDGTIEWARAQGYCVYEQKERGLWVGYLEAWPQFTGDVVITFSPDGNSIPELIPELIAKMQEGYDMVIASRYLGTARSLDDSLLTAFGNRFFTRTINLLYRGHLTDAMVMYRAYKTSLCQTLDLDKPEARATPERLLHTRIGWEPLLTVRAMKRHLKIAEIPGDEPPRVGGKAKLQMWRWGAAYLFQVIRDRFWWH